MHITIIGAGPIGSYAAWKHAEKGRDVTLIEEHEHIGAPVQCTGILTNEIRTHLSQKILKEITVAQVHKATIHGKNKTTTLPLGKEHIIDNQAYCKLLANKAQDAGAHIKTKTRYLHNDEKITTKSLTNNNITTHKTNILLAADGPTSSIAKHNKLYGKRTFYTGIQAVMHMQDYDEKIRFYPAIGAYAWYCPAGEGTARIGVAAPTNTKRIFEDFIKRFKGTRTCMQGGVIPIYTGKEHLERTHKALHVQLIGDAAAQVKNTTGGGIIPGTTAASIHVQDPYHYAQRLGKLKRELWTHKVLNNALQKMNEHEWDKLLTQVDDERIKKVLATNNRDNAKKMLPQIILKKPALALWARKLF